MSEERKFEKKNKANIQKMAKKDSIKKVTTE